MKARKHKLRARRGGLSHLRQAWPVDSTAVSETTPTLTDLGVLRLLRAGCNAEEIATYGRISHRMVNAWTARVLHQFADSEPAGRAG